MHQQVESEITEVELADRLVVYDKCNEHAWVEIQPETAVREIEQ